MVLYTRDNYFHEVCREPVTLLLFFPFFFLLFRKHLQSDNQSLFPNNKVSFRVNITNRKLFVRAGPYALASFLRGTHIIRKCKVGLDYYAVGYAQS